MSQVQKTETREERRVTREYYTDSNQDVPSGLNPPWGSNQLNNFSNNSLLDDFSNTNNWTTNNSSTSTTTRTNKTTSDLFDEARNSAANFFNQPSNTSNNSTTRKTVNTSTNKTFSSNLTDDNQSRNNFFPSSGASPYSSRPSSSPSPSSAPSNRHDIQNFKNNRPTMNTNRMNKTTANSLEEQLNSKEMKTCKVEDIWKVEPSRYSMVIPVDTQYGPDDVKITMKNGIMSVVVQKEKFSQYSGASLGYEGFAKSFSVPQDADFQGIKSTFTPTGLKIEVPRSRR